MSEEREVKSGATENEEPEAKTADEERVDSTDARPAVALAGRRTAANY